jgi:hypothetical protein
VRYCQEMQSVHCVRTYSEILSRDAICTLCEDIQWDTVKRCNLYTMWGHTVRYCQEMQSVHCVRTYSEILSRDAICTLTIHSILYSDFLNVCIYIHIYNRALTCIKTNKKCLYLLVTVLQLSIWHSSTMIIMTYWKLGSCT